MKKITLLIMLFVASIGLNAQSWTFEDTMDGWANIGATKKLNPTFLTLNAKEGAKNPNLSHDAAGVDADATSIIAFTIQNHDANGPMYIRIQFAKNEGHVYKGVDISNGDTEFKTYYIDLTNSNWKGTKNELKIQFKNGEKVDFIGTSALEQIDIDKIEMLSELPTVERHDFQFATEGDVEGFKDSNLGDLGAVASGGQLTLDLTRADSYPNIVQLDHHVVAEDYLTLEVSLKNLSPEDDTMTLILEDKTSFTTTIKTSSESSSFETYKVRLDTSAAWTGNMSNYKIRFGDASRPNPKKPENFGVSSGKGSVVIDYITFTTEVLSNEIIAKDDTQLSIYPNPVRNTLGVKSSAKVNSLQVYNVTGQEVLRASEATINTSSLTKGVYILKVSQEGGAISTKRFIKE